MQRITYLFIATFILLLSQVSYGLAQGSGEPGSPNATMTIDGKQLPPPPPEFGGVITDEALQSKPWWPPRVVPPKDAPNVLLIITDDAGFGVPSTFGGFIPTPAMDKLAEDGRRFTRVLSTALCSPTRAAQITGRNHHSVGFGVISEQSTGYPGYNSIIPKRQGDDWPNSAGQRVQHDLVWQRSQHTGFPGKPIRPI